MMQQVAAEVEEFAKHTLFGGDRNVMDRAESIEGRLMLVINRAKEVQSFLDPRLRSLSADYDEIKAAKELRNVTISQPDSELEHRVELLLDGWVLLRKQLADLVEKASDLNVAMGGALLDRLLMNSDMPISDKDSERR